MILKKFLSVFVSAMFTILIIAGLITVILINVKQQKADSFIADNGSSNSNNTDNENPDWLDRYIETKQQPFNILLFVTDIKGYDTDTIILFNIDSQNSKISAMSIPRDTLVKNQQKAISIYSTSTNTILKDEKVIDIFEELLGTEIKYTVKMNISVVQKIVDEMGGLYFHIPADMYYYDNGIDPVTGVYDPAQELVIEFKKGEKHLTGIEVVKLLRFRQPAPGTDSTELNEYYSERSDLNRIEMNKQILNAFFDQMFEMSRRNLISKVTSLLSIVYNDLDLYITLNDAQNILDLLMKSIPTDNNENYSWQGIQWYTLPGSTENISGTIYYHVDIPAVSTIIKNSFYTKLE
ncbi:MAG TPA: LCP family protein [Clostridia bacterium]|nr:LCP family protein [Clostridia bacterium]